jgi:hypothetical protein
MRKDLLKKLKAKLPRKYTETLSKRCKVSPAIVSKVLNGSISDYHKVIPEALKLKDEHQEELKKQEELLRNGLKK